MSNALENAASAFESEIRSEDGEAPAPSSRRQEQQEVENLFPNMGDSEDDEPAGGDGIPLVEPKQARAPRNPVEADDEDDDPLRAFDEGEDEDDQEPEKDDEDEDDQEPTFDVVIDGEPAKVTLKEMQEGYIRTATFHQRLNKLDQAATLVRREGAAVIERRDQTIASLKEAEGILSQLELKEPNWDELFQKNPNEARAIQKSHEEYQKTLNDIRGRIQQQEQAKAEDEFKQLQEYANEENARVAQAFPHWADPVRRKQEQDSMRKTAKALGFSDEEVNGIIDHRMILALSKAAAFDRMQARKATARPPKGKLKTNPGAGSSRTAPKGIARASQRLSRSGSIEDAARVFGGIISEE